MGRAGWGNGSWFFALAMLGVSIAAAVAISVARAGPAPGDLLPDLVADPPADVVLATDATGTAERLLLRFAGYVHNAGQGAVEIRGSRSSTTAAMAVTQRIFNGAGGWRDAPSPAGLIYEAGDGHHHWHLMHAARYSLWNSARSAEAAPAMKAGFCFEDTEHVEAHGPGAKVYGGSLNHWFCEQGRPDTLSVFHGVSSGWRDVYSNQLAFQWVDVSSVQPGSYWLRTDVDPGGVVFESVDANQPAWAGSLTTIPGYVAQPVDGGGVQAGSATSVTLSAQPFGSVGAVVYRIESAPAHGSLDVVPGASSQSATVVYQSQPGFQGVDSFTYSARDSTSTYPRSPAIATVTVRVDAPPSTPTVQINGAPEAVVAGTSVQLQATVTNGPPGVAWSVDGAEGGSAPSGTITPGGLYRAPAKPPSAGAVSIAARIAGGSAYDERRVRIVPAPVPNPAPLPHGSGAPPGHAQAPSRRRLTKPDVVRVGNRLIMTTTPMRPGRVRLTAYAGDRLLGSCSIRTPGGRPFACRLRISRAVEATAPIRVVASLRVNGRVVAVKTRGPAPVGDGHVHSR